MRAYLDIETTFTGAISVIGIYRPDLGTIQLVGGGVRDLPLYESLEGVETLVTFNGSCFDLPVIRRRLYADLKQDFEHCDLLYICRRRGLRGGLKKVEQMLGIGRATAGISGWDAPRLWQRYEANGDRAALQTLLDYNREDVVNLAVLERHLGLSEELPPCEVVRHVFA
ncbi:MAG TPA: ribonuclease H-like domain-containing protein [Roseiflexaceae bacterium]|nr:ribonuclease H-like domain-containing protein [Roseiflexaceae bacterium]